jgi:hypothetical protein
VQLANTQASVSLKISELKADVDLRIAKMQNDWLTRSAEIQAAAANTHAAQDKRICELEEAKRLLTWITGATLTALIAFTASVAYGLLTHQIHIGP